MCNKSEIYYQVEALVNGEWRRNFNKHTEVGRAEEWKSLIGRGGIDDIRIIKIETVEKINIQEVEVESIVA